jgi:hypothetical protein
MMVTWPILHGMKAGQCPRWKDRSWGQYGIVTPFARTVTYETGRSPWSGVNDSVPTGYSGQAALRRK